ncbi:MAG TPA: L-threonylcarbamoyladenylate synthase [Candidatus Rifleibacterium sp.]|nr:L-threonylcarbamoyladenylate synthase [Candidatus Rifleibacterium sp.]HPW60512.1 L-threonylcarbamoyladenylate synthase [Candidatus Rifleibacterium sp.]
MKRVPVDQLLKDKQLWNEFSVSLQNGGVAVIPTDTLYGFAVAADCEKAVTRVYEIKNRSSRKPLILFVDRVEELENLGFTLKDGLLAQLKKYWPGALTAILPAPGHPQLRAFNFSTMGVRIPNHQMLLEIIRRLPVRLLTTSANRSGDPSDVNPDVIASEFAGEIDWLIDGGILPEGMASTVADFTQSPPVILRQGKIKL